ncbi:6-bladed beta-propeller [Methanocella sp. MCL-LM]|uniref:6-bladed beta-propeller n=1 Tax=Methanocella sp. MCL-LM TaxID=3412035 RepID=UPI003C733A60
MRTRLTAILLVLLLCISLAQAQAAGEGIPVSATPDVINSGTTTAVQYSLAENESRILILINDSENETVRLVDEGVKGGGTHPVLWDGTYEDCSAVPDGIYEISVISRDAEDPLLIQYLAQWGSGGPGPFKNPWGIAISPTGLLYVTDRDNNRIQAFDASGSFVSQWGSAGAANGKFYSPWGIAVNSTGYVYVTDRNNCRIQVFDANGNFVAKWGSPGTGTGNFYYPEGIAVNATDYVYVADTINNRIQVFDPSGSYVTGWAINNPRGLAFNSTGYLYAVSSNSHQVQVFDPDNHYIGKWGSQGAGAGQFSYPWGIAIDSAGHVYISDVRNYRVQVFDAGGRYLTQFGAEKSGPCQFAYPTGIVIGATGQLYVVDTTNSRVVVYGQIKTASENRGSTWVTVDNTPPEIVISSPAGFYLLNQPVNAYWNAADRLSGVTAVSGTTPNGALVDTSVVGSHTYRVTAADLAGNVREEIVTYTVGYQFDGLLPPLGKAENASFKQGSAIPVKFRLADANGMVVAGATSSLNVSKLVDGDWGPEQAAGTKGKAGTAAYFRYDQTSEQYLYNLDTKQLTPGTWRLIVKLDDSTVHTETLELT